MGRSKAKDEEAIYLNHSAGKPVLEVAVDTQILGTTPEPAGERAQSRGIAFQLADQSLSWASFDKSLECSDFQAKVRRSEKDDSADRKTRADVRFQIGNRLMKQLVSECV